MDKKHTLLKTSECLALSFILHSLGLFILALNQENPPSLCQEKQTPPEIIYYTHVDDAKEQPIPQTVINPLDAPLINAPLVLYKSGKKKSEKPSDSESAQPSTSPEVKAPLEDSAPQESLKTPPEAEAEAGVQNQKKAQLQQQPLITPETPTWFHAPGSDQLPTDNTDSTLKEVTLSVQKIVDIPTKKPLPTDTSDGMRRRKLTLADLFKNLPNTYLPSSSSESHQEGDGDRAPAVIVQGDIRYHSFISAVVEHINATSIHNNGPSIIRGLLAQGDIKQNLQMSITLEKSGKVLDARVLVSSGCHALDTFWIKTAFESSPFAPLPTHFKRDMVRVELVTHF